MMVELLINQFKHTLVHIHICYHIYSLNYLNLLNLSLIYLSCLGDKFIVSLATSNDEIDKWLDHHVISSTKTLKKNKLKRVSIGLDIEWRPNYQVSIYHSYSSSLSHLYIISLNQAGAKPNKTALIQLSTSSACLLIPTYYFKVAKSNNEFKFSDKFKEFLVKSEVLKVPVLTLTLPLT